MIGIILQRYRAISLLCAALILMILLEIATSGLLSDESAPDPQESARSEATAQAAGKDPDHLEAVIKNRPLFDPTRQPPPPPAAATETAPPDFTDRYAGSIIGPDDRVAFFAEPPGSPPIAARVGDMVKGWKVVTINPDFVIISGASGETKLEPAYAPTGAVPFKQIRKPPPKRKTAVAAGPPIPGVSPPKPIGALRPGVAGGVQNPANGRQ